MQPVGEVKDFHASDSDISERERIRTKPGRKARSSVYVGVSHLKDGKWQAQIGINSQVSFSAYNLCLGACAFGSRPFLQGDCAWQCV